MPSSTLEGLRLFRRERVDPEPYYRFLAQQIVEQLPFDLAGARVLDLGAGPGYLARALEDEGAFVAALEPDADTLLRDVRPTGALQGDGMALPFPDGAFDVVFCSNVLEHTPDAREVLVEIERVLRPEGWAWVSWTNWYSPYGGHGIAPLHYLGPRLGVRAWERLFGPPPAESSVPFQSLWPTHIGPTLRFVRDRPGLELVDATPRYYPSQRWIVRVPGLREVITWNCLLLLRRSAPTG